MTLKEMLTEIQSDVMNRVRREVDDEDMERPAGTCPNCHAPNNDGSDDVCVVACQLKRS